MESLKQNYLGNKKVVTLKLQTLYYEFGNLLMEENNFYAGIGV